MKESLVDLDGDACVAIRDLCDLVLGGSTENLGDFGGAEFVVIREPLGHVGGGIAEGVVEGAAVAEGDDGGWAFDARTREMFVGDDVDGELDVHGGFERVAVEFAVTLQGVSIAQVKKRAGVGDGQVDGGAFGDLVEVHVAAVAAGVAGTGWCLRGACGRGDAAEHWFERDGVVGEAFGGPGG